jgi:hypothetical protein
MGSLVEEFVNYTSGLGFPSPWRMGSVKQWWASNAYLICLFDTFNLVLRCKRSGSEL